MFVRKHGPAILWSLFILVLMGFPGNQIPRIPSFIEWLSPDKILHIVLFGLFSYLVLYGNRKQYLRSKHRSGYVVVAVLISALYGLVTELLQYYVFIGRNANIYDFYANTLGALFGGMAYFLQHSKNKA